MTTVKLYASERACFLKESLESEGIFEEITGEAWVLAEGLSIPWKVS